MAFIQVITYRTDRREEMDALVERWLEDTEDVRRARKRLLLKDRRDKDSYMEVVFFDSYEDAMHNSELPATRLLSTAFEQLAVDGFDFRDFDLISDHL
jgi:chaperone required for assembly of F1-ATPase